jgi:hypothetical protein
VIGAMSSPREFKATTGFDVRDGTRVFPFLNSNDAKSGLPPGLLDDFSLAIGEIAPSSSSKIHVHPLVTQVTIVLDGRLTVRIRDLPAGTESSSPYVLFLAQHQAALVRPGSFLQLVNESLVPCRTLYIVGPAYAFAVDEHGEPVYDDAIALEESWEELEAVDWMPPRLVDAGVTDASRASAIQSTRERGST